MVLVADSSFSEDSRATCQSPTPFHVSSSGDHLPDDSFILSQLTWIHKYFIFTFVSVISYIHFQDEKRVRKVEGGGGERRGKGEGVKGGKGRKRERVGKRGKGGGEGWEEGAKGNFLCAEMTKARNVRQ